MDNPTDKTPRRIAARRMTGGLAALVTAGAMTTGTAQAANDTQPADDPILLAQASGEGEGESAAGGEGEGEGEGSAGLAPDTAFLSGLGFMEGHIRAGLALYEQGDLEAAKTHIGHPIEEKYDAVADRLAELGLDGMKDDLSALAAAAEDEADFEKVSSLFTPVHDGIEQARAEYKLVVSAVVKTVFAETDRDLAHARWREVADNLRDRFRDVAEIMDKAEHEVLASAAVDEGLRSKLQSTNPLERVNKGSSGAPMSSGSSRTERPSSASSALMLEQHDEGAVSRRYMPVEKLTAMCNVPGAATLIAAK